MTIASSVHQIGCSFDAKRAGGTTAGWVLIGTDAPGGDVPSHTPARRLDADMLAAFTRAGCHRLLAHGARLVHAVLRPKGANSAGAYRWWPPPAQ